MIKSANGKGYVEEFKTVQEWVFWKDINFDMLEKKLSIVLDVVHEALLR